MGLKATVYDYYGRMMGENTRTLTEDLLQDQDKNMMEFLKEMESSIKRHITECKREVIKEILRFERNLTTDEYVKPPREKVKYAGKSHG